MDVRQEIHDKVALELEKFKMPVMMIIGRDKYDQLAYECGFSKHDFISHITTSAGPLNITVDEDNPDYLWVGENTLLNVLSKLGLNE